MSISDGQMVTFSLFALRLSTIRNSIQNYDDARNKARDRPRHIHKSEPLVRDIVNIVTLNALDLMANQLALAKEPQSPSIQCSGIFSRTMGLPRRHELVHNLESSKGISLQTVDPHWHFNRVMIPQPTTQALPRLLAQELVVLEQDQGTASRKSL